MPLLLTSNSKIYSLLLGMLTVLSGLGYAYLAYFHERSDFYVFLVLEILLFGIYAIFLLAKPSYFWFLVGVGVVSRGIGFVSFPPLSDDYFRFFWDGMLLSQGYNPYLYLPSSLIERPLASDLGLSVALFEALNSPDYYTVYPPFNQLLFAGAVSLSFQQIWGAVLLMRFFIFLAELMGLFFLYYLLQFYRLPPTYVLIYWLNPLVIIEATGNLHFEGVMFAFVLMGIYFLQVKKNLYLAGLAFALGIATKLVPLLMLPLLWRYLGWRRGFVFCAFTGFWVLMSFVPFLSSELIANFASSIDLYFQKFEFNASVYYLSRSLGFWVYGYNIIATLGRVFSLLTLVGLISIALFFPLRRPQDLPQALLWSLAFYYLLATTVHPWYVLMLVGLSVFSSYRFALLWSFTVVFSYAAYLRADYREDLRWVFLEYFLVIGYLVWELYRERSYQASSIDA